MSSAQSTYDVLPPWVPHRPPNTWTLEAVQKHVKTGIIIELNTIPLYLYATWSIKNEGPGAEARGKIKGIFLQEMLHLALAGNILSALNGSLDIYDFQVIPQFPGKILYDEVELSLDRTNKESLDRFTKLEAPHTPLVHLLDAETTIIKDYHSIGEFYEKTKEGLSSRPDSDFKNNPDLQFTKDDFRYPDQQLSIIGSKDVAKAKLDLIIEQGEGSGGSTTNHYVIFRDLAKIAETWGLYRVRKNPKTIDYKGLGSPEDYAYKLSLTFDASYCYLLQNIQRVWAKGEAAHHARLVRNIKKLMSPILGVLAEILIRQKLKGDNDVAAPCFNYFPLSDDGKPLPPLGPKALREKALELAKEALKIAPDDDKSSLQGVVEEIEGSPHE